MATEEECLEALDKHEKKLTSLPGVVALGVVSEVETVDTPTSDKLAVGVYLKTLKHKDKVPDTLDIYIKNKKIKIKTRVIEQPEDITFEEPGNEGL